MNLAQFPRGLLDLLGIQNFGQAPKQLSDVVIPTVDTMEPYLTSRLATLGQQVTTPAVGFMAFSNLVVPANEVWVIKAFTAFGSAEAGVTFQISPAIRIPGTGGSQAPTLAAPQPVTANSQSSNGVCPPSLWLSSGTECGVRVDAVTGAPTAASNVNVNLLFARLRAGG